MITVEFEDVSDFILAGLAAKNNSIKTQKNLILSLRKCYNGYNELIGGVIYDYIEHICYLTIYTTSPTWATRSIIYKILKTPFEQNKNIKILRALTKNNNHKSNIMLKKLGFNFDGALRYETPDCETSHLWSLTLNELEASKWAE
jgi:RimJ/RimL family protein N-acetyltransferase